MRKFIDDRLNRQPPYAAISSIEIERTREEVKVLLKTARPGLVIGPKGAEVEKLKDALEDLTDRQVNICRMAELFTTLMQEGLGYTRYGTQGGDWGSMVASRLGSSPCPR